MTNGEVLRAKANEGLALWLATRIMCEDCPASVRCGEDWESRDYSPHGKKSCSQYMLEWLNEENGGDEGG